MYIKMPSQVEYIIKKLTDAGFEAYAVGGCVRDALLERRPNDWDITTSALTGQVKSLFSRTIDTGIQHGTVTVLYGGGSFEVTTYRIDGEYKDSRHPETVQFTTALSEDLLRRDFTINAMAYNHEDGVVDMFCGMEDLKNGIIRCVGVSEERFTEDALRILRAVRFSAQLGFTIDKGTEEAALKLSKNLINISAERIHAELNKLICSGHPDRLKKLPELGIAEVILPELCSLFESPKGNKNADELIRALMSAESEEKLRWGLFLYYLGSESTIMNRLKFDNATRYAVKKICEFADESFEHISDAAFRLLMNSIGKDCMELVLFASAAIHPERDNEEAFEHYKMICERGEATTLAELDITGRDLMAAGFPAGRELGELLNYLLFKVIEKPELNQNDVLLNLAHEYGK